MRRAMFALGLVIATGFGSSVVADDYRVGDLTVSAPWARATAGKANNGVAYLTITNRGGAKDHLLTVASPAARMTQVHTNMVEDGIMKMRPVTAVEINPGEPTVLRPGGLHIMLMGLMAPLRKGHSFPLTLTFETAGSVEVQVEVQSPGAMKPTHEGSHHRRREGS